MQHEQMVSNLVEPETGPSAQPHTSKFFPISLPILPPHALGPFRASTPPAYSFEDPSFDVDPFTVQVKDEAGMSLGGQGELVDWVDKNPQLTQLHSLEHKAMC